MRYLSNLVSTTAHEGAPWVFPSEQLQVPEECKKNKTARTRWISDTETRHCVYSGWEGLTSGGRILKGTNKREDNVPYKLHAIVVDYDTKLSPDEVAAGISRFAPHGPSHYGPSLSGNAHLVWTLERPLVISGFELAEKFLAVVSQKLRLAAAFPGFDEPAFKKPAQYYTSGDAGWYEIGNPLPAALVTGWLVEAAKKTDFDSPGYQIPLAAVREELLKRDPKFAASEWAECDFQEGAQGPSWWVEGSLSPKSAIVKSGGMFTFSAHATSSFYSWADLLGAKFVEAYRAKHMGAAVTGIYFDGRGFWREISRGMWKLFDKESTLSYLRVTRGLSGKPPKGEEVSELDVAYQYIIDHHFVDGAAPFCFRKGGLLEVDGNPFLNTHSTRVLRPVEHAVEWGNPDHFPFLSRFFGAPSGVQTDETRRLFEGGTVALDTFISWLSYYYKTAYELKIESGHNVFLSGPANRGKTLLNRGILGTLMGGFREARDYLMGTDSFGAELFGVGHWVVDDGTAGGSAAQSRHWTEMIKRMAANNTFRYHEKFRTPQQVEWKGRVVTTLNSDEESARLLPDLQRSVTDKVMLFRVSENSPVGDFPSVAELNIILANELPYFARFLLDWKVPEEVVLRRAGAIDWRFGGITPWIDDSLRAAANQGSRVSGFWEIVDDWRNEFFAAAAKSTDARVSKTQWTGTAFQLRKAICDMSQSSADALRGIDVGEMGRLLMQLHTTSYPVEFIDDTQGAVGGTRKWVLHAPKPISNEKQDTAPVVASAPVNKPDSKYNA